MQRADTAENKLYYLNELAVHESVMLIFEGVCIDARYEYEHMFLKNIFGTGIRNDKDSTYIEVQLNEWLKIDPATLNICFKNRKERQNES